MNSPKISSFCQSPRRAFFIRSPKKSAFNKSPKNLEIELKNEKDKKSEEEEKEEDDKEKEEEDNNNNKNIKEENKIIESTNLEKKEEVLPSFKERWKFKHPEPKKTLGKEIKEEIESTNNSNKINDSKSNGNSKNNSYKNDSIKNEKANNNSDKNDSHKSEKANNNSEKNDSHKSEKANNNADKNDSHKNEKENNNISDKNEDQKNEKTNNNNSDKNDNQKNAKTNNNIVFTPATKIPGMSENLLNHVNRRISNIISKCNIPLMNVEDYIICKKIGQGSYGIIFSVISKKDKKQYALKKIISNKLKQIGEFIKEFELVYSCKHENIMKIYSFCIRILDQTTYALYVLMELSECDWDKEIKQKLLQRKNYSEKELVNILYQLSSALLYIQEKYHISHRDIKPQNILVYEGGKYKLADFGEAKEAKVSRQINTLRGTELYMSPALYNGLKNEKNDVSHNPFKSDVFSLGFCFLYASALNFNLLYEVRDISDSKNINIILHKFLNKCYSEKLIQLFVSMLEIDEAKRLDFSEIKKYIEEKFPDMIKKE